MNTPYVKQFDSNGVIVNPITDRYLTSDDNRKKRREIKNRKAFTGQSKNFHLTVFRDFKFIRHLQIIRCKNGSIKRIEHYLPC